MARRSSKKSRPKRTGAKASGAGQGRPRFNQADPSDTDDTETRFVQPYQATKEYLCPGCNQIIPAGMGHMVAVPRHAPDLRRHWHRGCWTNRHRRR